MLKIGETYIQIHKLIYQRKLLKNNIVTEKDFLNILLVTQVIFVMK